MRARLSKNEIPQKIFESFNPNQLNKLEEIQIFLRKNNIDLLDVAPGRLSKYYSSGESAHSPLSVEKSLESFIRLTHQVWLILTKQPIFLLSFQSLMRLIVFIVTWRIWSHEKIKLSEMINQY